MKNINFFLEINKHWGTTKEWFNNISYNNYNFFPEIVDKISNDEKIHLSIKLTYFVKKIFELDDINDIDKIKLSEYDYTKLSNNIVENKDVLLSIIENKNLLKELLKYILKFKDYFPLMISKVKDILNPIFNDVNFDKLFKCDDDLTRIIAPICGSIFYIYVTERDIIKTINIFLELDIVFIQFFITSYIIIDDIMDDKNVHLENKAHFMKWFMNIVNNPKDEIILDETLENIWQCVTFKEFYTKFVLKYPPDNNKLIYDYVKIMIKTIKEAHNRQNDEDITEEVILEHTFKKSYVVSFFLVLFINIECKEENILDLCKILFLMQLYDDYADIDKDNDENNTTYFNSKNIDLSLEERLIKMMNAIFLCVEELQLIDEHLKNIIIYSVTYISMFLFYNHIDKTSDKFKDAILEYSFLSMNIIDYFNKNKNFQYTNKVYTRLLHRFLNFY
jgi:hypothetical protein